MKKFFTLCACACLAFTLSAQDSEHAAGSYYLGTGNALDLINLFSGDTDTNGNYTGIALSPTIGYAVIDDLVVSGLIAGPTDALWLELNVRYYWNGVFFQAGAANLLAPNDTESSFTLGAGKYFSLGSVSDRFYVDPQISYNFDLGFNTSIGLGARF